MVGVGTGILYLLVFTLAYCVIHLMYAEAVRMEPDEHNFAYLARKYLGSIFGSIATLIILIGFSLCSRFILFFLNHFSALCLVCLEHMQQFFSGF